MLFFVVGFFLFSFFGFTANAFASYASEVAADGAVSHWSLEESSGAVLDSIGSNNGTIVGTPSREEDGQVGNAYSFTSNQGINLPDDIFNSHTEGAIEAIIKINSTTGQYAIFGQGTENSSNFQIFLAVDGGRIKLLTRNGGTSQAIQGKTILNTDTYYHVAGQVCASGMQLFLNGVEETPYIVQSGSASSTIWLDDSTATVAADKYAIGYLNRFSPTIYYDGAIDEVAVYDAPKTAEVWFDHYEAAFPAPPDSISLNSPTNFQTFQRDTSNKADIPLSGSYVGTPTAIEARFNGQDWATIDAAPNGGSFSGTLTDQDASQGTLEVRFTNDISLSDSSTHVGIGDVFVVAGQSNASGRGVSAQSHGHPTLKATAFASASWNEANDPVSTDTSIGSIWPLLAKHIMDSQNVPVAFIIRTAGGTGILAPDDNWAKGGSDTPRMYELLTNQVTISGVNSVKAVLFHQGEREAAAFKSQADYNAGLDTLVANFKADFPGSPKTMVAQLGEQDSPATTASINDIRLAQIEAWSDNSDVLVGPIFYDLDLTDDLHLISDEELQTGADRWWSAIENIFYSGSDGRGPILSAAEYNSAKTQITLTFTDDSLPILPASGFGGIIVKDDGVEATISTITKTAANKLLITLSSAAVGTITVSLGDGNSASGLTVPTDSSTYNLPAEIFIDHSVLPATVSPSSSVSGSRRSVIIPVVLNPENTDVIIGCGNRVDGYSVVTGQSCATNVATIPGCDIRTIGFSIVDGRSCVGNRPTIPPVSSAPSIPSTTPTPSAYNLGSLTLQEGNRGPAVMELQRFLNDNPSTGSGPSVYNLSLVIDGILGPKTIAVIKQWQSDHNLVPDGLVGPKTKAVMNGVVR